MNVNEGMRVLIRYSDRQDVSFIVEDLAGFLSTQTESDELQIVMQKQTSKRMSTDDDDSMVLLEVLLGRSGERLYYQNDNTINNPKSTTTTTAISLEDKESILEDIQDALAERNWIRVQGQRIRPPQ